MAVVDEVRSGEQQLGERAWAWYQQVRPRLETPENIGKLLIVDVESGDYEIDDMGIESSRRLQARHPGAILYAIRIGYKTAVSFAGGLDRTDAE